MPSAISRAWHSRALRVSFGEYEGVTGHPVRQRHGGDRHSVVLPLEPGRLRILVHQVIAQGGVGIGQGRRHERLNRPRCHQVQGLGAPQHGGAGEQPRQTEGMVAVHMGDENGPQLHHRQGRVQQTVLCAFAAVDQVPLPGAAMGQGQAGHVAGFGRRAAGGAEKGQVHGFRPGR